MIFANVIQDAFSPLISVFRSVLVFLHDSVLGGSWGWAIIGLTICVRLVLLPLAFRQFKGMREMQKIAPLLRQIRERYKDDRQRQSEETMKLYREHHINPFASCMPLLLQFPVFISLFYMLRTDLKLNICGRGELGQRLMLYAHAHHWIAATATHVNQIPSGRLSGFSCNTIAPHVAKFLFIPDVNAKTTGVGLVVLIVLYIGSMLASSLVMSVAVDRNQRIMMIALPLVFTLFIFQFPGGLLVYWITTNIFTILQQLLLKRQAGGALPALAPAPAVSGSRGSAARVAAGTPPGGKNGRGGESAEDEEDEVATAGARGGAQRSAAAPPPPPRKRKRRSGRRR